MFKNTVFCSWCIFVSVSYLLLDLLVSFLFLCKASLTALVVSLLISFFLVSICSLYFAWKEPRSLFLCIISLSFSSEAFSLISRAFSSFLCKTSFQSLHFLSLSLNSPFLSSFFPLPPFANKVPAFSFLKSPVFSSPIDQG